MREGSRTWLWRGVVVLFLTFALLLFYALWLLGPTGKEATVRIPKGATGQEVARILEEAGLLRSGYLFSAYLRFSGRAKRLVPGVYRLEGEGAFRLARALTGGERPLTVTLTFPEGERGVDYARRLSQAGLDGEGFLRLVREPGAVRPSFVEGPTLEGYLFPATYTFDLLVGPEEVVRAMLSRFAAELTPPVRRLLEEQGLSVHAWVTLASIVQAEAGSPEEMPKIAGVFLNRLERGMPLQADPTVAYALGKRLPELSRRAGDFGVDSPYNTYRYPGLPPGPIGNPGRAALLAVLNPVRTDPKGRPYLYFFHAKGRLFLNADFEGHLQDLARHRYSSP
ncbi:endolytic transglycosylase MltG [Thermus tengchongensis]|uniref:endolytic transglycosylase MltG n=1 Tax=Thermus tengchongensis TaxID=1214928 RepID=UPI001430E528|nr:endolytic transglycosylase MltG [Thermus tengchongensis]